MAPRSSSASRDGPGVAATLPVLLSGVDLTGGAFTAASNRASARLPDLQDGENVLEVEGVGRWRCLRQGFAGRAQEMRFRARRPLDLDRG